MSGVLQAEGTAHKVLGQRLACVGTGGDWPDGDLGSGVVEGQ